MKPNDIPVAPHHAYANDGWAGWSDWLGASAIATYSSQYRFFGKTRALVYRFWLGQLPRSDFGATGKSRAYHWRDYRQSGGACSRTEDAAQIAELIAVDLSCSETADRIGSHVQVSNAAGQKLFSIPVLAAA